MTATTLHDAAPLSAEVRASRRTLLLLNLIGGTAVLASYAWGLSAGPEVTGALWGGVPEALRPLYTVNMFLAAAGYLVFTSYLYLGATPEQLRIRGGYGLVNLFYFLVLLPSTLWLPLTAQMIEAPGVTLWALIRLDLLLVGVGAVGLLLSVVKVDAPGSRWRIAAILGALPFVLQTAVLDALVWPAFYPHP